MLWSLTTVASGGSAVVEVRTRGCATSTGSSARIVETVASVVAVVPVVEAVVSVVELDELAGP